MGAFERYNRSRGSRGEESSGNDEAADDEDDDEKENGDKAKQSRKGKGDAPISLKDLLDGLIPYSERHFNRIDKLVQESYMLDYVVGEMDGGLFGGEVMDVDVDGEGEGTNGH